MSKKRGKTTRVKKNGNPLNFELNKDKLEATKKKRWVLEAIDLMKTGYSNAYIREHIMTNKEGAVSVAYIDSILSIANNEIVNSQFSKSEEIIPLHINRYNRQIKRLLETKDGDDLLANADDEVVIDPETYYKLRDKKIRAFSDCLDTMKLKEELLQFHHKDFVINYNLEEEVKIKDSPLKINLDKLTLEEQVELYQLIKKARKSENELAQIILNTTTSEVIEDITHEEVVEKPNIDQIKIEEKEVEIKKLPITSVDPTIRLKEALARVAAKKLREAGATLTDEENELLK